MQQDEPGDHPKYIAHDRCGEEADQGGNLLVDADEASDGEGKEDEVDGNIPATVPENLSSKLMMCQKS